MLRMLPVEALMQEHRVIERMVALFKLESVRIEQAKKVNMKFVQAAVDFIRMYADLTHLGKEEGILFRALSLKPLVEEDVGMMRVLIAEHVRSRKLTSSLEQAVTSFMNGNGESGRDISRILNELAEFYTMHTAKEDNSFFYPVSRYFSAEEHKAMLGDFWEFDRKLIHEKYERVVGEMEKMVETAEG